MITSTDLLPLRYTPDLTEGGIAYACRCLASDSGHMGSARGVPGIGTQVDRLRHSVVEAIVELAFRRFLSEQAVPFNVLGASPFTKPGHYDVALGGHRCDLKSYFISHRAQITQIRRDPALVLQASALLPLEQFAAEDHKPDDLVLFAFLLGVAAASLEEVDKAAAAGQPACLVYPLPGEWSRPANWLALEALALKSECELPIQVEIGGLDAGREFVSLQLELPPKKRVPVEQEFYSLAYVHTQRRPGRRIGLHSPTRGEVLLLQPVDWGNIWVYGMDILLTGWLSHEEFRRKAKVLNAGMSTFQYDRTRVKNLCVPVAELNPLGPLLAHVKEWEAAKTLVMEPGRLKI